MHSGLTPGQRARTNATTAENGTSESMSRRNQTQACWMAVSMAFSRPTPDSALTVARAAARPSQRTSSILEAERVRIFASPWILRHPDLSKVFYFNGIASDLRDNVLRHLCVTPGWFASPARIFASPDFSSNGDFAGTFIPIECDLGSGLSQHGSCQTQAAGQRA